MSTFCRCFVDTIKLNKLKVKLNLLPHISHRILFNLLFKTTLQMTLCWLFMSSQQNAIQTLIQNYFANWLYTDNSCLVHFKSKCQIEPFATHLTTECCPIFDSKLLWKLTLCWQLCLVLFKSTIQNYWCKIITKSLWRVVFTEKSEQDSSVRTVAKSSNIHLDLKAQDMKYHH